MQLESITLNEIATPSAVRTQNGHDKQSLTELANSIKAQGLLQNLVVRHANPDEQAEHGKPFVMVAGRRRLAAVKMLDWTAAPCLVLNIEDATAYEAEVAENLQREQMTLADTAAAVRTLMSIYNNARKVGEVLNKSASWVSKHLAVTSSKCPEEVKALMDQGLVTDLETLTLLKQIGEMKGAEAAAQFKRLCKIGGEENLNRQMVRDSLAKLRDPGPAPSPAPKIRRVLTTGETEIVTEEEGENAPATHFLVKLPIALLEKFGRLGGNEWMAKAIEGAEEPDSAPEAQ